MNRQYPVQPMARALQDQGRYGDTVLVHMNPAEVEGIAALSPTGKLTINPVTGQPEAFLPMLAGILGSVGGTAMLGSSLGPVLARAIGSGVATAAVTGDLKRGLAAGVMGGAPWSLEGSVMFGASEGRSGRGGVSSRALRARSGRGCYLAGPMAWAPSAAVPRVQPLQKRTRVHASRRAERSRG